MADSASLNWQVNGSNKCKLGVAVATGSFTTNGVGGTVNYYWIEQDSSGTYVKATQALVIASGDKSSHSVAQDTWVPQSNGTDTLVFTKPQAQSPATQSIQTSITCRP